MVNILNKTFNGNRHPDDRDHISNKRCETSGVLVNDIFKALWKKTITTVQTQ